MSAPFRMLSAEEGIRFADVEGVTFFKVADLRNSLVEKVPFYLRTDRAGGFDVIINDYRLTSPSDFLHFKSGVERGRIGFWCNARMMKVIVDDYNDPSVMKEALEKHRKMKFGRKSSVAKSEPITMEPPAPAKEEITEKKTSASEAMKRVFDLLNKNGDDLIAAIRSEREITSDTRDKVENCLIQIDQLTMAQTDVHRRIDGIDRKLNDILEILNRPKPSVLDRARKFADTCRIAACRLLKCDSQH